jgi:protein-tyrosine kinase
MSRFFEALSGLKMEHGPRQVRAPLKVAPAEDPVEIVPPASKHALKTQHHPLQVVQSALAPLPLAAPERVRDAQVLNNAVAQPAGTLETPSIAVNVSPGSHLVAWTEPYGLGAEKFRALVTRFEHLRNKRELKSFQVTSSVNHEGKTLVAANVAITLAMYSGSKTLLVEGDLHRPALANLFGLGELRGLHDWWPSADEEFGKFVRQLNGMPLWFLPAGKPCDQPADLLRSRRFAKAFTQLASQFEWIVVDSTPMLPIIDANLWSKLVDGTLLVVREGLTPRKTLQKGLQALDHPKLIGVVMNGASGTDQVNYDGKYYGARQSTVRD